MGGELVYLIHPDAAVRDRLGEALHRAGFKRLGFPGGREAAQQLDGYQSLPDALLAPLEEVGGEGSSSPLLERLRSHPLTESLPVLVLASGEADERRRALRVGLTQQIQPPYPDEEVVLSIRLALEQLRQDRRVSGSLRQMSATDLLQTAEAGRRSGTFHFRGPDDTVTLWVDQGSIVDASSRNGLQGKEALFEAISWERGSFEVDFGEIAVPRRIEGSTPALLLEAVHWVDERNRRSARLHAALADPPPPPPRAQRVVHRALTLLNVAASYATDHLIPSLVALRLETDRQDLLSELPELDLFRTNDVGQVTLAPGVDEPRGDGAGGEAPPAWSRVDPERMVAAASQWLLRSFRSLDRGRPGLFTLDRLRAVTDAIHYDLESLGFDQALGIERPATAAEEASREPSPRPESGVQNGHGRLQAAPRQAPAPTAGLQAGPAGSRGEEPAERQSA